jgi:hypothetical protein
MNYILLKFNTDELHIHFHLNLTTADLDENKFSDCTFAGNVHFLVTDDKTFCDGKINTLLFINFIILDQFKEITHGQCLNPIWISYVVV